MWKWTKDLWREDRVILIAYVIGSIIGGLCLSVLIGSLLT